MAMNVDKYNAYIKAINEERPLHSANAVTNIVKITDEKQTFRFLPFTDGEPFKVVYKHYIKIPGTKKTDQHLCLGKNEDILGTKDNCPICEFGWKLWNDAKKVLNGRDYKKLSKEEIAMSSDLREAISNIEVFKEMMPKAIVYTNVVVRGKEDEGAKVLWLTEATFKKILRLREDGIDNEEDKDITDPVRGTDYKIFKIKTGKAFDEIDVISANQKVLTKDENLLKKILSGVKEAPISESEVPTAEALEKSLLTKFKLTESEVEQLSSEKVVTPGKSKLDDAEVDDLDKMMKEMSN